MFPRLLASVALCLALSPAEALAERGHHGPRQGHHRDSHYRDSYTRVVYRPVHVTPRRAVYVEAAPHYHRPRHVEHRHHHHCDHDRALALLGTAIVAGAIVHELQH